MDILVLRDLENTIRKDVPTFKVGFKNESFLMKVFGFLSYPYNPNFSTTFATTLGTMVYFPTRSYYEENLENSFEVLTHEYVHLWDKARNKLFGWTYVFPQALAAVGLVTFGVLALTSAWLVLLPFVGYLLAALVGRKSFVGFAIVLGVFLLATLGLSVWLVRWDTFAFVGALFCLIPWPAPWRASAELRGYEMDLAVLLWRGEAYSSDLRKSFVDEFVGPGYYFMSWSRTKIEAAFDETAAQAMNGILQERPPYTTIHDFLKQHNLLRH